MQCYVVLSLMKMFHEWCYQFENTAVNNFPGMLLPNKVYNTSIEVTNNADAEAEIRWVGGRPSTSAKEEKKTQTFF